MVKIMAIKCNTQFPSIWQMISIASLEFHFPDTLCEIVELLKSDKTQIKIFYVKMQKLK